MNERTPKQRATLATEKLRELDAWASSEKAAIMASESLRPDAKQKRITALRSEYQARWLGQKQEAERWLAEEAEVFEGRAAKAWEPKRPQDKDGRIMQALDLQRLSGRIERAASLDEPGRLLAEYERAVQTNNAHVAHELEEALPGLLPDSERQDFEARARENRMARMSDSDRRAVAEAEEFEREAGSVGQALYIMESNRARGYVPAPPTPTTLITSHRPGGDPPEVTEVPNHAWRDPSRDAPVNEPAGGTVV